MTVAAAPLEPSDPPPVPRGRELDDVTVRRAQRGDPAACRALVAHHQGAVFALLGRVLGGGRRALVEDLAQDTFLAVFQGLPGFSTAGPARLSTWILAIASRRAIDELRRRRPPPIAIADLVADPRGEAASEAINRRQLAAAIDRALAELPPEYRAAFVLRELHGLDYGEIAAALEIEVGTVRSRLHRARAALRTALAEVRHER